MELFHYQIADTNNAQKLPLRAKYKLIPLVTPGVFVVEMAETGRTRVRRFVTEKDVAADVTLHEEHAEVIRKAIADTAFVGDIDWADDEIEVIETAERAVAKKTAKIVEEVALRKVGTDHVETIHDKIRRQLVEIGRTGADGRIAPVEHRPI